MLLSSMDGMSVHCLFSPPTGGSISMPRAWDGNPARGIEPAATAHLWRLAMRQSRRMVLLLCCCSDRPLFGTDPVFNTRPGIRKHLCPAADSLPGIQVQTDQLDERSFNDFASP